jgi:hypothetical protein
MIMIIIIKYDRLHQKVLKSGIDHFSVDDTVEFFMSCSLRNQQESSKSVEK